MVLAQGVGVLLNRWSVRLGFSVHGSGRAPGGVAPAARRLPKS